MTDRAGVEHLLRALYAARADGHLDRLCALFAADARFRIAGSSAGKPISISAQGLAEIRPWLATMVKTFKLVDHTILSMAIDGSRAAVHWRASILSKVTGVTAATDLVDLVEIADGAIGDYLEFFVPSAPVD
jgi:ketosteroid isomerase-like protein